MTILGNTNCFHLSSDIPILQNDFKLFFSECVTLLNSAIDFVKNVQPKKLLPMSGKLKREVSMEEIIQLTDELSQSFDRHGNR